jgi:pilus assembly protein CpaE
MTNLAHKISNAALPVTPSVGDVIEIYRVPQITIHAFCETPDVMNILKTSAADRRMGRAHSDIDMGGIDAAIDRYRHIATPNLLIVESSAAPHAIRAQLDTLANVCTASTKVIVIGHNNDVDLYRDLLAAGISEYLVAPLDLMSIIAVISRVYRAPGAAKLG